MNPFSELPPVYNDQNDHNTRIIEAYLDHQEKVAQHDRANATAMNDRIALYKMSALSFLPISFQTAIYHGHPHLRQIHETTADICKTLVIPDEHAFSIGSLVAMIGMASLVMARLTTPQPALKPFDSNDVPHGPA
jgi:hypothetical protein